MNLGGLKGLKLITFDAINTLLKFRMPPWHYYALVAKDFGFTGTEHDVKEKFIDSYNFMWKRYPNFGKRVIPWDTWWQKVIKQTFDGKMPKDNDIVALSKILIEEYKTSKLWCVAAGGRRLLYLLEKEGITLGIISNSDPRLHDILRSVGIIKHFRHIITSYEAGFSKPGKKIFTLAMQKCELKLPSECLHIGNNIKKDYEAAKSAGWRALVVPADGDEMTGEKLPPPEHIYPSLETLALAIERKDFVIK